MAKKNTVKKADIEIEVEDIVETITEARPDLEAVRQAVKESVKDLPTTSAKIRALSAAGYPTKEISKILGILYQHARNVLTTPLKRPAAAYKKMVEVEQ